MAVVEKNHKYSPFQRRVINELPKLVGDRAYNYELCANNHMQILIQCVDKPIYCASTPSDSRAFANVSSEIRKRIKEADAGRLFDTSDSNSYDATTPDLNIKRVVSSAIKAFRNQKADFERIEMEAASNGADLSVIKTLRRQFVSELIAHGCILINSSPANFAVADYCKVSNKLAAHINFSLPTLAYYSAIQKESTEKSMSEISRETIANKLQKCIEDAISELRHSGEKFGDVSVELNVKGISIAEMTFPFIPTAIPNMPMMEFPDLFPEPEVTTGKHLTSVFEKAETQEALAAELKQFDASKLDLLIAACEAAKAEQKKEADMKEVIRMMEEKGLNLEQIAAYLGEQAA